MMRLPRRPERRLPGTHPGPDPCANQRGLTLTELTVVMIIAGLVTIGLVTFYINSQATWVDGSTQAFTQREGTVLVEEISRQTHLSVDAVVTDLPDASHQTLSLIDALNNVHQYTWNPADSLVHEIVTPDGGSPEDKGALITSKVRRLQFGTAGSIVYVHGVELITPNAQLVEIRSAAAMYNRAPSP